MGNNSPKQRKKRAWSVYILRCADKTLYTGIAKDVSARMKAHRLGKGAAYTRGRGPLTLLREERGLTHSQALRREVRIKKLSRAKKEALLKGRDGIMPGSFKRGS